MQLPGEFSPFVEEKNVFLLSGRGVTPPYTLSGPITKKTLFSWKFVMLKITNDRRMDRVGWIKKNFKNKCLFEKP